MIDSRDFLAARRRAINEVLFPAGPKIAFTGGLDFTDHHLTWDVALDVGTLAAAFAKAQIGRKRTGSSEDAGSEICR